MAGLSVLVGEISLDVRFALLIRQVARRLAEQGPVVNHRQLSHEE